jgi:hypothetical protein
VSTWVSFVAWKGADGVGVLLRDDRFVVSIMSHECYMPGIDASAGYWSAFSVDCTGPGLHQA